MITVLFVDDEPALLDVSRIYLERSGELKVDTCNSAREALKFLKERSYDAIVCDYEMPGMDGIAFLKHLRRVGDTTPFIVFTGKGREHIVIEALNSGADFYLQKGGDPRSQFTELIHNIKQAVTREKAELSLQITKYSVERASEQIFWLDTKGRFIYANEAACTALGYTPEELLLLTLPDIDLEMDHEKWNTFLETLRVKKELAINTRHKRKDGSQFSAEISSNYFESQGKGVIFSYSRDISTWTESQGVSVEIRQRCREITDMMPGPFMILTQDGKVEFSNLAALSILGYTSDHLTTGLTLPEIAEPVELSRIQDILTRAARGEAVTSMKTALLHRNGSRIPVSISIMPQNESNNVLIGIFISLVKEESQDRYKILFEEACEGMLLISNRIVECNKKACEILGYKEEEIGGHTLLDISPPYQPDGKESSIAMFEYLHAVASGKPQLFTWNFSNKNGDISSIEIFLKLIFIGERKFILASLALKSND